MKTEEIIDHIQSQINNNLHFAYLLTRKKKIKLIDENNEWQEDMITDISLDNGKFVFWTENGHRLRSFQFLFLD